MTGIRLDWAALEPQIRRWHAEGKTQGWIAEHLGVSPSSVSKRLQPLGLYWHAARKPSDKCSAGHVYNEVGYYLSAGGSRQCKVCHRAKARARHKRLAMEASQDREQSACAALDRAMDLMVAAEIAPPWERKEAKRMALRALETTR